MKKILVIEDNQVVRENIAEILALSGYSVLEAENGKIGVLKAREERPDLILCDVMMPVLDGFGVLKILNKDVSLNHIPFMFLTARTEKEDFRKGMGLGADDYITKPFDDVELLEAIEMRLTKAQRINNIDNSSSGFKSFFNELEAERQFAELAKSKESRIYAKRSVVYAESQHPRWVYYVQSGSVKCLRTNEFGKELIINIYSPGEFFGYLNVISQTPYDDSAVSMKRTELKLIPLEEFNSFIFTQRDFSVKFIKMLATHTEKKEENLMHFAYSSVRKRLARALILLLEKNGGSTIKISRDDLASLAGIAKETTIRTLSDFKHEKILSIESKSIIILDEEKLHNMPF